MIIQRRAYIFYTSCFIFNRNVIKNKVDRYFRDGVGMHACNGVHCITVIQTVRECRCGRNTRTISHATWSSKALSRPVSPCSRRSATTTVVCGRTSTDNCRKLPPLTTCSSIRCCCNSSTCSVPARLSSPHTSQYLPV